MSEFMSELLAKLHEEWQRLEKLLPFCATVNAWEVGGPMPSVSVIACVNYQEHDNGAVEPIYEPICVVDQRIDGDDDPGAKAIAEMIVFLRNNIAGIFSEAARACTQVRMVAAELEEWQKDYERLAAAGLDLLELIDSVPGDLPGGQTDRVFARYEFDALRAALHQSLPDSAKVVQRSMQVLPDSVGQYATAEAITSVHGFDYKGPGWYVQDGYSALVVAEGQGPPEMDLDLLPWHKHRPGPFTVYGWRCSLQETYFGVMAAPVRRDDRT